MNLKPVIENLKSDEPLTHLAALLLLISETADQKIPSLVQDLFKTPPHYSTESSSHSIVPLSSFLANAKEQLEKLLEQIEKQDPISPGHSAIKEEREQPLKLRKARFEPNSENRPPNPESSKALEKSFIANVKVAIQTLTKLSNTLEAQTIKDTIKKLRPLFEEWMSREEKEINRVPREEKPVARPLPLSFKEKEAALPVLNKKNKTVQTFEKKRTVSVEKRSDLPKGKGAEEVATKKPLKPNKEQSDLTSLPLSRIVPKKLNRSSPKTAVTKSFRVLIEEDLDSRGETKRGEAQVAGSRPLRFDRVTIPAAPFTAPPPFLFNRPKKKRKTFWFREEEDQHKDDLKNNE